MSSMRHSTMLMITAAAMATVAAIAICVCYDKRRKVETERTKSGQKKKTQREPAAKAESQKNKSKSNSTDSEMSPDSATLFNCDAITIQPVSVSTFTFTLNLFRACGEQTRHEPNAGFVVSPLAVQMTFGACFLGAKELTRKQLAAVFFPAMSEAGAADVLRSLDAVTSDCDCWRTVGRLYTPADWLQRYPAEHRRLSRVEFLRSDGQKSRAETIDRLNEWARNGVPSLGRKLVDEKSTSASTPGVESCRRALSVFSLFACEGRLKHPFPPRLVSRHGHQFLSSDGRRLLRDVPMMHNGSGELHGYFEDAQCQVLRLELHCVYGKEAAVYIVLPKRHGGLTQLEMTLTPHRFLDTISCCIEPKVVRVVLPAMRFSHRFDAINALKALGVRRAFDKRSADFDEADEQTGDRLCIIDTVHAATFQLIEGPTKPEVLSKSDEAQNPATPNSPKSSEPNSCPFCKVRSNENRKETQVKFIADQPFLFVVALEKPTLIPVLIGRFCGEQAQVSGETS